ncbi:hypothetical protein CMI44_02370 [Candidatus Pacearchaeota archaeon]|jgi:2-(3-amino-3-carboxypropyl)histidine synthase|nr:hypothetical protein [Candidatus Pacearchaeota archaeon]|tara:strand:- start:404 stop:1021 length:618 start_codon:yes stop_codon:yes gene_type:complete
MKPLFIPTKLKSKVNKSRILEISKKLPKNIAIAYPIQYEDQAGEMKKVLSKKHNITKFTQVLGCSKPKLPKSTQALLLISDGKFHAVSLAIGTDFPIYIYNGNRLEKISDKDVRSMRQKQKVAYLKFLNAKKVGILVSTKPNQQNLKKALALKSKLKNKDSYIFIGNNLNPAEFENFGLDVYINTACPRLIFDSEKIMDISEIKP